MNFPSAPAHFQTERAGVIAVATEINRLGLIWRETPLTDVGIDGQIEFVNDAGQATGQLLAVQVKSGASYFDDKGAYWRFYPDPKHRYYWERFPFPVIVVLHSPADGVTYWTDAQYALRNPETSELKYIRIPKENHLQRTTAEKLFATAGAFSRPYLPVEEIIPRMADIRLENPSFLVSYLDLFVNGLANLSRSIYYGMDISTRLASLFSQTGNLQIGQTEHNFLFDFVLFLAEQHLADVDLSDAMIDWYDRQMHPTFIAPLTSRGRTVVRLLNEVQSFYEGTGALPNPSGVRVIQEGYIEMFFTPSHFSKIHIAQNLAALIRLSKSTA